MIRLLTGIIICALLTGCATNGQTKRDGQTIREAAAPLGIKLTLTEVARDGDFDVYPGDPFHTIDVNSTLRLDFNLPATPEGLDEDEKWVRLADMLKRWNESVARIRDLAVRAAELETAREEDKDFTAAADQAGKEISGLLREAFAKELISNADMVAVGRSGADPYAVLVDAINRRQEQLRREAEQFQRSLAKYKAVVRAAVLPRTGGRQALHIPGWDKLPSGDYNPYDPTAILPNAAESERLQRELEGAKRVVEAHRELSKNGDSIRDQLRTVVEKLGNDLHDELDVMIDAWKKFDIDSLSALGGDSEGKTALKAITDDLERVEKIQATIRRIRAGRATPQNVGPLANDLSELSKSVPNWPVELALDFVSSTIVDQASADVRANLEELKRAVTQASRSLQTSLPKTVSALKFFETAVKNSSAIDSIESMELPRLLTDIQSAELDLRYGGIAIGDSVEMTVELQPDDKSQGPAPVRYTAQVSRTGWHRRYSGDVYFVRALDGPTDNSFQSNVGLSLEWHNWDRAKPNGWLNRLDPGLGFHAAFLNQDADESVEFGGGINASLLDGLIRVGYGYNISVEEDRGYWFVGFGLFSMLGQMSDFGSEILPSAR